MARNTIFISYSHKDESWKDILLQQIGRWEAATGVEVWNDRQIRAGDQWLEQITSAVDRSAIAILLVSENFLKSDFIQNNELPLLLQKEAQEGLRIIPLLVEACDWKPVDWIQRLQLRPLEGKVLSDYPPETRTSLIDDFVKEISALRKGYLERFRIKLRQYLLTVKHDAERAPLYFPQGTNLTNIRVKVKVSPKGALASRLEAQYREHILQTPPSSAGLYRYRMNSMGLKVAASGSFFEDTGAKVFYWDQEVRNKLMRGVVVGDPGFGKSWLLRWEAVRLASEALHQLDNGADPGQLLYPVTMRLYDLSQALDTYGGVIPDAVTGSLQQMELLELEDAPQRPDAELRGFLRKRIIAGHAVLLLDALDEVPQGEMRRNLLNAFGEWVPKNPAARLIITSRHSNYEPPWANIRQTDEERELELLPFDDEQIRHFISSWFGEDFDNAEKMRQLIRASPQLRGMAELPLLLGFLCSLFQHEQRPGVFSLLSGQSIAEVNRSRLYEGIVDSLLLRLWDRTRPEYGDHLPLQQSSLLQRRRKILEALAFQYFLEDKVQFAQDDLESRVAKLNAQLGMEPMQSPVQLVQELSQVLGVMIQGGQLADANMQFLFLHLTIQEYLAAVFLGRMVNRDGWDGAALENGLFIRDLISKKAWDPRWEQVVLLLAGILENPVPLIDLLTDPGRDDIYKHGSALASHCLGEAWLGRNSMREFLLPHRDRLAGQMYGEWFQHLERSTGALALHIRDTFPVLLRMQSRVDGKALFDLLVAQLRHNPKGHIGNAVVNILEKAGNELLANEQYVEQLLEVYFSTNNSSVAEKLSELFFELAAPLFESTFFPGQLVKAIQNCNPKQLLHFTQFILSYIDSTNRHFTAFQQIRPIYESSPGSSTRAMVADLLHKSKATYIFYMIDAIMQNEEVNCEGILQDVEGARLALFLNGVFDSNYFEDDDEYALSILDNVMQLQEQIFSQNGDELVKMADDFRIDGVGLREILLAQDETMREIFQDDGMWGAMLSIVAGGMANGGIGKVVRFANNPGELIAHSPVLLKGLENLIKSGVPEIQIAALQALVNFHEGLDQYELPEESKTKIHSEIDELLETMDLAIGTEQDQRVLGELLSASLKLRNTPEKARQSARFIRHLFQTEDNDLLKDFFRDLFRRAGNILYKYDAFIDSYARASSKIDPEQVFSQQEVNRHLAKDREYVDTLLKIFDTEIDAQVRARVTLELSHQKQGDYRHEDVLDCIEVCLNSQNDLMLASGLEAVKTIGKSVASRPNIIRGIIRGIRTINHEDYAEEACRAIKVLSGLDSRESKLQQEILLEAIEVLLVSCRRAKSPAVRSGAASAITALCAARFRIFKQPQSKGMWWKKLLHNKPEYIIRPIQELE